MPMRNGVIKKVAFYPRILVTKSFITKKLQVLNRTLFRTQSHQQVNWVKQDEKNTWLSSDNFNPD